MSVYILGSPEAVNIAHRAYLRKRGAAIVTWVLVVVEFVKKMPGEGELSLVREGLAFKCLHLGHKMRLELVCIMTEMRSAVAIGTKRDNVPRVIWAAVRNPSNMMGLKIRGASRAEKRSRCLAVFACACGPREDVVSNVGRSLIDRSCARFAGDSRFSSGVRASPQDVYVHRFCGWQLLLGQIHDRIERAQFEDDCLSRISVAVLPVLVVPTLADHFVFEYDMPRGMLLLEEQEGLPVGQVVCDRLVAASQGHVTLLAFAEVLYQSVGMLSVIIAELEAALSADHKNYRMLGGGDNPALPLATEPGVYVVAAIVSSAALKSECHLISPRPMASEISPQSVDSSKARFSSTHGEVRLTSRNQECQLRTCPQAFAVDPRGPKNADGMKVVPSLDGRFSRMAA